MQSSGLSSALDTPSTIEAKAIRTKMHKIFDIAIESQVTQLMSCELLSENSQAVTVGEDRVGPGPDGL